MAYAAQLSTYLQGKLLGLTLGATAFTPAATLYCRLYTVMPTAAGTGGTEVSGGGYAVQSLTNNTTNFPAANPTITGTAITFPTCTVAWGTVVGYAFWDASSAGNMYNFSRLHASRKQVESVSTGASTLTMTSHGLSNGQLVEVYSPLGTVPGGLTEFTAYYVVGATANTIQLSATLGGSAITLTTTGTGAIWCAQTYQQAVIPGNIFTIPAGSISLSIA